MHIISTDEKTGVQATEHLHPSIPAEPGKVERIEQEYIRHGTVTLIAGRDIVTGQIADAMVGPTRKEGDFVQHLKNMVGNDPDASYIFIMDQLNTHKSEQMVRFVAAECNISDDLGIKGESGILKSMESRAEFLTRSDHRIRIVYTPKHSSWLNQIECWFSILGRRLLNKRASFKSKESLKTKILEFIKYYNENLAKPFKWNSTEKLLKWCKFI